MQVTSAFIWSTIISIAVIVIAQILATEYRMKREREERAKERKADEQLYAATCPPCPVCGSGNIPIANNPIIPGA